MQWPLWTKTPFWHELASDTSAEHTLPLVLLVAKIAGGLLTLTE